jgi:microsomal dipeptidase-like Zn-dependent dipeptidase
MRVMVALSVNSMTFAKGLAGNEPYDDKTTGDLQTAEMKRMVNRHRWMEIAYSSRDLRRIVSQDKLAIILGSELDDIGNFAWRKRGEPSAREVKAEVNRLYRQGIRYIFPVHVIDNHFGGTAIYESEFPRASKYHFGKWPKIICAAPGDGIFNHFSSGWDVIKTFALGNAGKGFKTPRCSGGRGFKNARGLTPIGRIALDEMMRLGMIIDLDHASQKTADQILMHADRRGRYPIVSGHNSLRARGLHAHENSRTRNQYRSIARLGGVAGIGFGELTPEQFIVKVQEALRAAPSLPINLGSDINGYVIMPKPDRRKCPRTGCIKYGPKFPMARMGSKRWNYNTEGVAHIGLFPDFLRHLEGLRGGRDVVNRLFNGAESVAKTWERAESTGRRFKASGTGKFSNVFAIIRTADDDVRNGARAWVTVNYRGGKTREIEVSQLAKGSNKANRVKISLGRSLRVSDIVSVTVRHFSNKCFGCARDYWKGSIELEGENGEAIMRTPSFRIGHQSKTFPRR